jgi:Trk K+ transport system NAD-binding subunit
MRERTRSICLVGDGELPRSVHRSLGRAEADVRWLRRPNDRELSAAMRDGADAVAIVSRNDVEALRLALVAHHANPEVPLLVTIYDRTVASQMRSAVPGARVTSLADLVAPTLAAPCFGAGLATPAESSGPVVGVSAEGGEPVLLPAPRSLRARFADWLRSAARPLDTSGRILVAGVVGFVAILALDTVVTGIALDEPPVEAFFAATKTLVTVGPNPVVDHASDWFKLFSAATMLAGLAFVALLTAGIVNRLLDPRLTGIFGRRAIPRANHVIVVGLGQVGMRLCLLLRGLDVPVVAVEIDIEARNVPLAKAYKVPVVIASGADRFLLQRLSLKRARALAAVTSDDLTNITVAVAALAARRDLRVILRAGDGDIATETRSLFHVGVVRDVHRIAGELLAAHTLGLVEEAPPRSREP